MEKSHSSFRRVGRSWVVPAFVLSICVLAKLHWTKVSDPGAPVAMEVETSAGNYTWVRRPSSMSVATVIACQTVCVSSGPLQSMSLGAAVACDVSTVSGEGEPGDDRRGGDVDVRGCRAASAAA
jgi:hypothetical protein